jgi:hypothetical protein
MTVKAILSNFIKNAQDKRILIDSFEQTIFNFDKNELEKLKVSNEETVKRYLHKNAKRFTKIGTVNKRTDFPNNLVICSQQTKHSEVVGYCAGNRLIIEQKKLNEIISVLANDILNPLKWKWLFNPIFINRSVNFFRFIRHPGESIFVEPV